MLALPWRKYSIHEYSIEGLKINAVETPNDSRGTGLILWDGAFVLGKYLEKRYGQDGLRGRTVLELGCGTGLAGLSAAALGADLVVLTDLEYALENTRANVAVNPLLSSRIRCCELDWFRPDMNVLEGARPDVVLLADVAWVTELVVPLVKTIAAVCDYSKPKQVEILLSHQTRSLRTDELLFEQLRSHGFSVVKAAPDEYFDGYDGVNIYKVCSLPQQKCD